jgi:ribosomal protein S3AE
MTMINNTAADFIAFLESDRPTACAVVALLGSEGFTVSRLREAVTAPAVSTPAAVSAVDVRAAIDAAVLAALDGINLREAIASLVEERVTNADLDIEEMAKEVISDKADDLDMEDLAKEVISDLAGELDMEELAKSAMEDNVDYADVVRDVIEAEFTRTDIKHEIREAITERITERLSNVQVSVTV